MAIQSLSLCVPRASPASAEGKSSSSLDMLLLVALEIHVVLATPLVRAFSHRSRLGLSVDSAFRHWSASLALPTA